MAKFTNPHFKEEQGILKKVWSECSAWLQKLNSSLHERQAKKEAAIQNQKEGYGQVQILSREIRNLNEKIRKASRALNRVYFGKVQYVEDGVWNTVYIGDYYLECLSDETVVSSDADIADLFYYQKGVYRSTAENRDKTIDLRLVRRLVVDNDDLLDINDLFLSGKLLEYDPFLIKQLGRSGQDRHKGIVMTIQAEQREIIRAPVDKHLIVQGSAGTGKTIVLVYRVAYLLRALK